MFQAGLEGPNAVVGGLGIVVRDLNRELNKSGKVDCFTVTPLYNFLATQLLKENKLYSLGFVKSFIFNQDKFTEVFYNPIDRQLLLSADESCRDGLDAVKTPNDIYEPTQSYLRLVYFNSALCALVNTLKVDVLNTHGYHLSLAQELLRTHMINPNLKIVTTLHMLNHEHGKDSKEIFKHVGLSDENKIEANLLELQIASADRIVTVSDSLRLNCLSEKMSFGMIEHFLKKESHLYGITNGLRYSDFAPHRRKILDDFYLKPGFSLADLKRSKSDAKSFAFREGLIASDSKPLMVFLGRFGSEKGVEFLPFITKRWIELGGQMVIMGLYTQDSTAKKHVNNLIEEQQSNDIYKNNLRVYTELSQQTERIKNLNNLAKGKLIRYAGDYACLPSEAEACGLVGLEALALGSPLFTSWVQGLKDFALPLNVEHPLLKKVISEEEFNSISFQYFPENFEATINDINTNIVRAFNLTQQNNYVFLKAQQRAILSGPSFDWHSKNGAIEKYVNLYGLGYYQERFELNTMSENSSSKEPGLIQSLMMGKAGFYPKSKVIFSNSNSEMPFVLCTLHQAKREPEIEANRPSIKDETRVTIKDELLFWQGQPLNTATMPKVYANTYAINKKGELFIGAQCHAYFLKSTPGKPSYGYAKPIACAGDIIVENGKIVQIDNRSGHYKPNADQLILALKYLDKKGLLSEKCEIFDETPNISESAVPIELSQVRSTNEEKIFKKYPSLKKVREIEE